MPDIKASVSDEALQKNLSRYLSETSKTAIDAINFKLYDGDREAIKQTPKANKNTILAKLNEHSSKYPDRTVVEMLVITQMRANGQDVFNLEQEVQKFKGKNFHIGFAKSGWLPGLKTLISKIGKSFVSVSGVSSVGYGGAEPARQTGGTIQGSIYNDVEGTGNKAFVQSIKEHGGRAAVDKINYDIESYFDKELKKPTDKFNR